MIDQFVLIYLLRLLQQLSDFYSFMVCASTCLFYSVNRPHAVTIFFVDQSRAFNVLLCA